MGMPEGSHQDAKGIRRAKHSDKPLTPAAQRALAEAEARRKADRRERPQAPKEEGGRGGLEPGRYGDWEIKGLTSDF